MAELWGIITSGDLVTTDQLEFDYGDGRGFVQSTKNPLWFENFTYRQLRGRVKTAYRNVSLAIYINGFLSNDILSNENWLIDIDQEAGMITFEWIGSADLFNNVFLLQVNTI